MRFIGILGLCGFVVLGGMAYQADAAELSWDAENFSARNGEGFAVLTPPFTVNANEATTAARAPELVDADGNPTTEYTIEGPVFGGAFVGAGTPDSFTSDGSWLKYTFSVPVAGEWYFWGRLVAPTQGDNSFHWGIDIADADAIAADNNNVNIWDFFEVAELIDRYTTEWVWFRLNSRTGNPFPGIELDQYEEFGNNITPVELTLGSHTFHLITREKAYLDAMFATTDVTFNPNETPPVSVEPQGKLTTTWGALKGGF